MIATAELIERVCQSRSLPALPATALEVLRLTQSEGASAEALAAVISRDPTLAARLLKLVNSPLFGVRREVSSIQQAVAMVGQRAVRVTALSVSLTETVRAKPGDGFDYEAYWRASLTSAVAGRLIARASAADLVEEAFIAGLLSQIGRLAAHRAAPERYAEALAHRDRHGGRLRDAERAALGVTGAAIGRALLETWNLPTGVCLAVGACQGDGLADVPEPHQRLGRVVHAAVVTANLFCSEIAAGALDEVKSVVRTCAGLGETELEAVLSELDAHVRQTAADLSLEIGATTDYEAIREQAAMELAMLSVEAEAERTVVAARAQEAEAESRRLHAEKRRIIEVATTDALTRIPNRAAFERRLDEALAGARAPDRAVGLIMLDVDHFKMFNDTHGHQAGDAVLRAVAGALRDACAGSAFVARWGGEEFTALGEFVSASAAAGLAERIRRAIESASVAWDGRSLRVTASVGVAVGEPGGGATTGEALIAEADARLYEAKRGGRNRVACAAA